MKYLPYKPEQIIVGFRNANQEMVKTTIESYGLTIIEKLSRFSYLVKVPVGQEKEWVRRLAQDPNVTGTQLNHIRTTRRS